jgi:hypothetical protein
MFFTVRSKTRTTDFSMDFSAIDHRQEITQPSKRIWLMGQRISNDIKSFYPVSRGPANGLLKWTRLIKA